MNSENIILIGAGNLASHLAPALTGAGYNLLQVYSRSEQSAMELAEKNNTKWTTDLGDLDPEAEILIYAVSDSIMPQLFCQIELSKRIMIHTAGSIPADVFRGVARDYGVLYPVMTFSRGRDMDFRKVPVCIEGNNDNSLQVLEKMAGRLSNHVVHMDSEQRKKLHLAGIIASNFSNHMYRLSADYLREQDLDPVLLKPLIQETAVKILEMDPAEAQTGPARRNDTSVIEDHLEMLKDRPELQKLYTFVSDSITKSY